MSDISIDDFGGDPSGVNDSTAALNAAFAAIGSNGCIRFSVGIYKFLSSITCTLPSNTPAAILLDGQGPSGTVLYWPSANGLVFNCSNQAQTVNIRGMAFTCGGVGVQTAIVVNQSSPLGTFETSVFFNLTFRGQTNNSATYWGTGAVINNYSATSWDSVTFLGGGANGGGTGITFQGTGVGGVSGPNFSIYHNIAKSIFNSLGIGLNYGGYSQGITVTQCNFQNTQVGIFSPSSPVSEGQSQLNIDNNQFNCFNTAILLQSGVSNVSISGNDIIVNDTENSNAISVSGSPYGTIYGNNINSLGSGSTFGIVLNNCSSWNVSSNVIDGFGQGILLLGNTDNSIVSTNTYNVCVVKVTDASTSLGNQILFDNQSPVANLSVGASPWTYTAGSSPETVYIFNGSVNNVSKNGVFVATATNTSVHLKPHESLVVTYSSKPNVSSEKM
jgi:hypothetical protein